ncbi:MAG: putative lipid II flippase FtsW [Pseudomonadota bacterium]|nr:putative lipid II flippase FtsW [Pseudomonadota bacterium]
MVSRADRSVFAEWWWTVDRLLLALFLLLIMAGVVLSFAASPAVAQRLGLDSLYFVKRQIVFALPAIPILVATSFMDARTLRRVCLVVFVVALALMAATLVVGAEIKGARRWISLAGLSLQPSEFVKPAFVILAAWLFAESVKRPDMPGVPLALALVGSVAGLLVLQPDFGQTLLIVLVWAALYFMAGMPWLLIAGLGGAGAAALVAAYEAVPHVRKRIDSFLDPAAVSYQIEQALKSVGNGGFLGRGPGEGAAKRVLPDAHTDFIFAVVVEEYGALLAMVLVAVFAAIIMRGLMRSLREEDLFTRLAIAGLVLLFGLQASINFAVNLHMMPAKGMTLPFISYGGSSALAMAFGMGLLLALARRRPRLAVRSRPVAAAGSAA